MRALRDPPSGFQYHGCSSELSGQRDVASSPYLPVDRHSSALANQRMAAAASARLEPSRQAWVSTSVPGPQRLPLCSSIGWRGNVRDGHHEGKLEPRSPPGVLAVPPRCLKLPSGFSHLCQTFSGKSVKYRFQELSSIAFPNIFCLEKIISGTQRPGIQDVVRDFRTRASNVLESYGGVTVSSRAAVVVKHFTRAARPMGGGACAGRARGALLPHRLCLRSSSTSSGPVCVCVCVCPSVRPCRLLPSFVRRAWALFSLKGVATLLTVAVVAKVCRLLTGHWCHRARPGSTVGFPVCEPVIDLAGEPTIRLVWQVHCVVSPRIDGRSSRRRGHPG